MWAVIVFLTIGLYNMFKNPQSSSSQKQNIIFSEFLSEVENGRVVQVEIQGNNIRGIMSNGEKFTTYSPNDPNLIEKLSDKGVSISAAPLDEKMPSIFGVLLSWFPMLLLIAVWIFFMRQMQGGKGGAMGFGRSKAKLMSDARKKVTFDDVAGIDEAKEEVQEIVEFLKSPKKFMKVGGKIPRGALLVGSPGTGKTLLARAIAGESGVPFFTISGSDFVEMFVGVGAARVRDMFEQGKKNSPCIIFIDELDAVGRSRGAGLGGGNDEREQTLNQILVEMDGFETNDGVIILASTNRPDVLDPALLRPGRFDRQVTVDRPDYAGRLQILNVHAKDKTLSKDVDLDKVARRTPGFTGADLANLLNEAAILAARKDLDKVSNDEVGDAIERVMAGPEKKDRVISDKKKELVAYHEAGHAVVALFTPEADPVHKVTIIPRGRALGVTMQLPLDEKHGYSKKYITGRLAVMMGGRSAEEIIFNEITTGASNDIERATSIAKKMVCEWGMSDVLGPMTFGKKNEEIFLGREIQSHRDYSEATARMIDEEVVRIVRKSQSTAKRILKQNIGQLHNLAKALLEHETIDGEEVAAVMEGKQIKRSKNGAAQKLKKKRRRRKPQNKKPEISGKN